MSFLSRDTFFEGRGEIGCDALSGGHDANLYKVGDRLKSVSFLQKSEDDSVILDYQSSFEKSR